MKSEEDKKKPVVPPDQWVKFTDHHWLRQRGHDGEDYGLIVLQWIPWSKQWYTSGNLATIGRLIETNGWDYIDHCRQPGLEISE